MAAIPMATDPSTDATSAGAEWLSPRTGRRRPGASLLDADPDLGRNLEPGVRVRLAPALRVGIERVECGVWDPERIAHGPQMLGLLVLDGLLLRDVSVRHRCCAELLGPGDLLRPWAHPAGVGEDLMSAEPAWHVVDGPARLAVIDQRASFVIGRFPSLMGELLDRSLMRARTLQFQLALTQVAGIPRRIELLLWHLADRWGRVTLDGVVLPLNLTHEMLGRLIGARRPSVTTALGRLQDAGTVVRSGETWLLRGDPSADAAEPASVPPLGA